PTAAPPTACKAPSPPLDPPAVRARSHGLFVRPYNLLSVSWQKHISGVFVFPRIIAPSSFHLPTTAASVSRKAFLRLKRPAVVFMPLTSNDSFTLMGTPAS